MNSDILEVVSYDIVEETAQAKSKKSGAIGILFFVLSVLQEEIDVKSTIARKEAHYRYR